ncbi:MAG TPA: Gfo/Idh/MocA family oxidoreductase [Candidatus Hydrogenedentes bacterium]|nr:Gfo/Idh/MocA family oxidoreductase [Candidatus Hydrogenedentota bacterium]HPG66075.1 Gfo/Idh/MocA family oxidoreductase [Candidatus Hydrogenedentota bacterium]
MSTVASTKKTRIGVIGVGQIGKHHIENYRQIEDAEVVAIADIDEAEARRVSERFGIPDIYCCADELLARDDIEAVDVCLHNNLHMHYTCAGLKAGKHVYCEKPMAGAYCDAETMLRTARELDRKLQIQLSTLFSRETKAAKQIIDGGHLGRIYHARSTGFRRRGRPFVDGYGTHKFVNKKISAGGAMFDMGVYHISNILYLLGNPLVQTITGKTYQETDMHAKRREFSKYSVEELGLGFVRLADDLTLDIIESWAIHLNAFEGSSIVGSQGGVRLEPFGYFTNMADLEMNCTANLDALDYRLHNVHEVGDVYDSPQHHWVAALRGRVALLPTAEIALNTMLISEGIYLSSKLGREVTADEVRAASTSTATDREMP